MLRITVHDECEAMTLELEGRLTGPSVAELQRIWQSLAPSLGSRPVRINLCGVTHMDANGIRVLAEIHQQTGGALLADTPITTYYAEEVQRPRTDGTAPGGVNARRGSS